jgi:hypothetical protein
VKIPQLPDGLHHGRRTTLWHGSPGLVGHRGGVLTVALVAFVGLALTLVGCSPDDSAESVHGNTGVVDEWIQAANPLWNDGKAIRVMRGIKDDIT